MAVSTTSLDPRVRIEPLSSVPEVLRTQSALPNQMISFTVLQQVTSGEGSGAFTAPTPGNHQRLNFTCALPANFAYILVEFHAQIYVNSGSDNDWSNIASMYTRVDNQQGQRLFNDYTELVSSGVNYFGNSRVQMKQYTPAQGNSRVLVGENASLVVDFATDGIDGAAGTSDITARFLMVPVEQALHAGINTPTYVRP